MDIQELEKMAGIQNKNPADSEETTRDLYQQFTGAKAFTNDKDVVIDSGLEQGPGEGFTGKENFTKDELNAIMDLQDELNRMDNFE